MHRCRQPFRRCLARQSGGVEALRCGLARCQRPLPAPLQLIDARRPPLRLVGTVWRSVTVPIHVDRRPWRHLARRPYRLLLQENFTRYEADGRMGYGMAEITRRPS